MLITLGDTLQCNGLLLLILSNILEGFVIFFFLFFFLFEAKRVKHELALVNNGSEVIFGFVYMDDRL